MRRRAADAVAATPVPGPVPERFVLDEWLPGVSAERSPWDSPRDWQRHRNARAYLAYLAARRQAAGRSGGPRRG